MMDPDDILVINYLFDVMIYYMLTTFIDAVCYGASFILFSLALWNLWHRFRSSSAIRILFIVVTLLFSLMTISSTSNLADNVIQSRSFHLYSSSIPVRDQPVQSMADNVTTTLWFIVQTFPTPIGNAVIVWRAWVLYPFNLPVRLALLFFWFSAAVLVLLHNALDAAGYIQPAIAERFGTELMNTLLAVQTFLSFGVNLAATGSIAWKAWRHHSVLKSGMVKTSKVIPVLFSLIEWGAVLAIAQLVFAITQVVYPGGDPADPGFIATSMLQEFLQDFSAVHPALMVLVLAKQRSFIDNSTFAAPSQFQYSAAEQGTIGHLSTLRFAEAEMNRQQSQQDESQDHSDLTQASLNKKEVNERAV